MNGSDPNGQRHMYVREGVLLLGFALLLVAAAFSVVLPELSEDPDAQTTTGDAGTP